MEMDIDGEERAEQLRDKAKRLVQARESRVTRVDARVSLLLSPDVSALGLSLRSCVAGAISQDLKADIKRRFNRLRGRPEDDMDGEDEEVM